MPAEWQVYKISSSPFFIFLWDACDCSWIIRYIQFYQCRVHPKEMGVQQIEAFLSHQATHERVAAATQRQALNALVFLYRKVLDVPFEREITPIRARRTARPPTVLVREEVNALLQHLAGTHLLMAQLLYGSGLRLMECVRLRIKDFDFERKQLFVRAGKGNKDRVSLLPVPLQSRLQEHIERVRTLHQGDLSAGFGQVSDRLGAGKSTVQTSHFPVERLAQVRRVSGIPRSGLLSCSPRY